MAQRALTQADVERSLLRAVCDLDEVVTVWTDDEMLFINEAASRVSGYSLAELNALPSFFELVVPEQRERVRREAKAPGYHVMTIRRKDGQLVDLEIRRHPVTLASGPVMVSVARDISALTEAQRQLAHAATHDAITGLANQSRLLAEIRDAIAAGGAGPALVVLDLDGVKEVNETFGRPAGDALLAATARRLREQLRERGTLARVGGDELAVLLPQTDERSAQSTAQELRSAMTRPFVVDGHPIVLSAVAGIAIFPQGGHDAVGLLRAADAAVYQARRRGRGSAIFAAAEDADRSDRLTLMADLREAIGAEQLLLHYQPILDLRSRRIVGAEALVRWAHPRRGVIPPAVFVPLAAASGLGRALTDRVLRTALEEYRALHRRGQLLPMLVNVTASDLADEKFIGSVEAYARTHRASEKWLKIELTESELVSDHARIVPVLRRLRELGVILAIDDYGTGYSSLSYLHRLPVDAIKLDRSFALGLGKPRIDAIVRSTVSLGHDLGYLVGAEGVEDPEVLERLGTIGCDFAQGYGIARPMPAPALAKWLQGHRRSANDPAARLAPTAV